MKIVIDTNVFISGTLWYGIPNRIIELIDFKNIDLVLSQEILQEFSEVLQYDEIQNKIKIKNFEMTYTLKKITELAQIVDPKKKHKVIKDDPDDDKFIDAAVEGDVDYLVSKDKHLLNLKEFNGIKIVSPEEFLGLYNGNIEK